MSDSVISAVGHETDTTIADFVADLRAPTPSAAAELAVYEYRQYEELLYDYRYRLDRQLRHQVNRYRSRLEQMGLKLRYLSPVNQIREKRTYALKMEEQLEQAMQTVLIKKRHKLEMYIERLKGLSPLDKLNQGFSYVADESGKAVIDIDKVEVGSVLNIHVTNGRIIARTLDKESVEWEAGNRN